MYFRLSDEALRATAFTWSQPEVPEEDAREDEEMEEDAEVNLDKVEEEMAAEYSDEEEGDILHIDDFTNYAVKERGGSGKEERELARPEDIMESNTDSEMWRLEVERVAPGLKITVKTDSRDWRSHLDQMHQYRAGIDESLTTTKTSLDKLQTDISKTLEKITSREKYLNSQLESQLSEYR